MTKVQQNHLKSFNNTLLVLKELKHILFMHPFSFWGDFFKGGFFLCFPKGYNHML